MLEPPGEATRTPFAKRSQRLPWSKCNPRAEYPKFHQADGFAGSFAIPGYQLFSRGWPPSLTGPPPVRTHPSPQPGEERHLAGSFPGFHLEKQSNGFYGCSSPAQNIKAGFAHWSLQKGRMKTRVHICTFMSCHRRRLFLKNPAKLQESGKKRKPG